MKIYNHSCRHDFTKQGESPVVASTKINPFVRLWKNRLWRKRLIAAFIVLAVRITTFVASGLPWERGPIMSSWILWTAVIVWFALGNDWGESK